MMNPPDLKRDDEGKHGDGKHGDGSKRQRQHQTTGTSLEPHKKKPKEPTGSNASRRLEHYQMIASASLTQGDTLESRNGTVQGRIALPPYDQAVGPMQGRPIQQTERAPAEMGSFSEGFLLNQPIFGTDILSSRYATENLIRHFQQQQQQQQQVWSQFRSTIRNPGESWAQQMPQRPSDPVQSGWYNRQMLTATTPRFGNESLIHTTNFNMNDRQWTADTQLHSGHGSQVSGNRNQVGLNDRRSAIETLLGENGPFLRASRAHSDIPPLQSDEHPSLHVAQRHLSVSNDMSGSFSALLAHSRDSAVMTPRQAYLRRQIVFFVATEEYIATHVRGRTKALGLGQVGIRCRHCAHLPLSRLQKGSTYFPVSVKGIYQAAQNMCTTHIQCGLCVEIPDSVKDEFYRLLVNRPTSSSIGGREYWAESARLQGLYDTEGGIYYKCAT